MGKAIPKSHSEEGHIDLLPETDDRTLCVSVHGVISVEDYEEYIYKRLDAMVKKGKKFALVLHYDPSYKGWSKEAADRSFQSIINHGRHARKLAYVNPPESKIFQLKVAKDLFSGEIRFFENDELAEALKWAKI